MRFFPTTHSLRARVVLAELCIACLLSPTQIKSNQTPPDSPRPAPSEPAAAASTNAPLTSLGPGRYRLGQDVTLDKKAGTVEFPAVVNLTESPMEYVLVTTYGKIHESILRTDVRPHEIHLAMLLIGAEGAPTNRWPESESEDLPGDAISIAVSWNADGTTLTRQAEDLVLERPSGASMAHSPWRYTGSFIWQGTFLAEQEGSIISLITDQAALINNPNPSRADDDRWLPNKQALPAEETRVTVQIKLTRADQPTADAKRNE